MPSKLILSLALICFSLACHGGGGVLGKEYLKTKTSTPKAGNGIVHKQITKTKNILVQQLIGAVEDQLYYSQLFKATCNFGRFGVIDIQEGYDDTVLLPTPAPFRYLKVTGEINGLCSTSSYQLTFNVYNNNLKRCTKVGPILGGPLGNIVSNSTSVTGNFVVNQLQVKGLSIVPQTVAPMNIMGGSCVIRLSNPYPSGFNTPNPFDYHCYKPSCPSVICTGVKMVPANLATTIADLS